jgi:hypothetical protein
MKHHKTTLMILLKAKTNCKKKLLTTGEAVCGSPTPLDCAIALRWASKTRSILVTTGVKIINVWSVDDKSRKLIPEQCDVGRKKRTNQCVVTPSSSSLNNFLTILYFLNL